MNIMCDTSLITGCRICVFAGGLSKIPCYNYEEWLRSKRDILRG